MSGEDKGEVFLDDLRTGFELEPDLDEELADSSGVGVAIALR